LGGAYGWQPIDTLFLKDGHIQGSGGNHYTLCTYKVKGDGAVLRIDLNRYGKANLVWSKEQTGLLDRKNQSGQ